MSYVITVFPGWLPDCKGWVGHNAGLPKPVTMYQTAMFAPMD